MRRKTIGFLGRSFLFAVTSVAAVAVFAIILFIARDALPFFRDRTSLEFFVSKSWYPSHTPPQFGAAAIFFGSFLVTAAAVILAVPSGVMAAICLSDILPFKARQLVKPVIEILAAIPSVVYGFFALTVVAPFLQNAGEWLPGNIEIASGVNALNASVILAIMALPTIVSVSEDALQAAGRELREGSYALGATRSETLLKVVIPAAFSGIFSAVLLGIMRAMGETMVVWMASGNAAQIPKPWYNLLQPVRTLTATIAGDMGEADQMSGSAHYHVLFVMGLCLLLFSFGCNIAGEWVVARQRKKLRGE
ncbi:MAG TPA: phosphate ABC transporter permease subunit PstC [Kiritimatiellia bacterium]|jgi:phosphate transport system permease protein|nr:phosphate ABC transporter permease subunit PstC [Kiritimatiellia bacterium]HRU18901.1 phosphate ABC transporter permease subunit PstC [Kiritimatiellia bacterium]